MTNEVITKEEGRITKDLLEAQAPAPLSLGGLSIRGDNGQGLIERATQIANTLKPVIDAHSMSVSMKGQPKKFVTCEGWTTLLAILGCGVREVSVDHHPIKGWIAKVEIFRLKDPEQAIGAASGMVMPKERWKDNAARSMAITRATSKVCRLSFSWVMTLAGYAPTPAEEVISSDAKETERMPAVDPIITVALLREAVHVANGTLCARQFNEWYRSLSAYGKRCLSSKESLAELSALKESLIVAQENKDEG